MARKTQKQIDAEITGRIQKRAPAWFTYFSKNNEVFRSDTRAVYEEDALWSKAEIKEYKEDGRPRLSFNMLPRYITNLAAEFAENVPDLEVRSEHFEEVDQHVIDLTTNLLRNISLDSRNDLVYKIAAQNAWTGGYGAFRIITERENPLSFNFVIRYESVYDPTTCFWDPNAKKIDKSDGQYCGIARPMPKEEFEAKYPKAQTPENSPYDSADFKWVSEDQIIIVDYWEKVPVKKRMALLSDNSVVPADQAEIIVRRKNKEIRFKQDGTSGIPPVKIERIETLVDSKIMFYRVTRDEVLEKSEWDGNLLPIIFVAGIQKWVGGKERTYGLIHWMKDAQKAYNYARSEYLYRLQLTRYEKFFVTKENVAGHETAWQDIHKAKSALIYKTGIDGSKPIVVPPISIGNDLQAEMTRSLQDLQLIPGRFDPNFGAQGNETSGIAISTRQRGGNLNIKEFYDNIFDAIESGARVTANLIPKIYDTSRRVTVTQDSGDQVSTSINTNQSNTFQNVLFNVKIKVGSSFEVQQQEAVNQLIGLTRDDPQLAELSSDLIAENLNLKNASQLVERIRRWKIPKIAASEGSNDPVVKQNALKAQQNPAAQLQQQAATLELQSKQLELQQQQQNLKASVQTMINERLKALSSQNQGQASIMNANTNQSEAAVKGAQESQKIQAEESRTRAQSEIEQLKVFKELIGQQPQ